MLIFNTHGVGPSVSEFHRLSKVHRQLADDLDLLALGEGPSDENMFWSPYIDCYRVSSRTRPCLHGLVSGHPKLSPMGREVLTSELIAYSPKLKLARTRSRWYRLGTPASAFEGECE